MILQMIMIVKFFSDYENPDNYSNQLYSKNDCLNGIKKK